MTKEQHEDGGPAFPVAEDHKVAADLPWTCGMTLRDYFAAKAMQALAGEGGTEAFKRGTMEHVAFISYVMADAMLKARNA